jgi:hypothetical protein
LHRCHMSGIVVGIRASLTLSRYSISYRITGNPESAGINRHVVGDARALQERK